MERNFHNEGCAHTWKSGICNPNTDFARDIEEAEVAWIKNGKAPVQRAARDPIPGKRNRPLLKKGGWTGAALGTVKKSKVTLTQE